MKHRWIGLPGRHIENQTLLTYFQAPCRRQKLRNWIYIHMNIYLYICVRFQLKFSTGQVAPKPDSPVQNRTSGNPIDGLVMFCDTTDICMKLLKTE